MPYETVKIIKGHRYGYLVESYRKDGKVRQRILEYRGRLDTDPQEVPETEHSWEYFLASRIRKRKLKVKVDL